MEAHEEPLDHAIDELLQLAAERGAADELEETLGSFHASANPSTPEETLAARRAFEHFVLERHSPLLQGVPVELALHGLLGDPEDLPDEERLESLVSSFSGVFEVTDVRPGEGAWVRDLLAFGEHPLVEPEGSHALQPGDLLVGRMYPVGGGLHRISRAAGVFRNPQLAEALTADLESAREGRRSVLRLSLVELEAMFWGRPAAVTRDEVLERARAVLMDGGVTLADVEQIFARLALRPVDVGRVLHGMHDELGEILDGLAFGTDVDLDAARRALLEAWPLLNAGLDQPPAAAPRPPATSVNEAIAAFDRGRREGRDLEELFTQLERDLELEDDDEQDEGPAPDFPGVVGAMVEEFLWETEREHGEERARAFAALQRLSTFGASIGLFEELGARQLLSFATIWLPEWGDLAGPDDARAVLAALRAFCEWTQEHQEVPLREVYERELASLEDNLPRIARANAARAPSEDASDGEVFLVVEGGADLQLLDASGAALSPALPPELAGNLRPGDRLRATRAPDGGLTVHCCYPPECAALVQAAE